MPLFPAAVGVVAGLWSRKLKVSSLWEVHLLCSLQDHAMSCSGPPGLLRSVQGTKSSVDVLAARLSHLNLVQISPGGRLKLADKGSSSSGLTPSQPEAINKAAAITAISPTCSLASSKTC